MPGKRRLRVLGIETSCDETSVAILDVSEKSTRIVFHEIASQIPAHQIYGGVVPEVAARLHVKEIVELLDLALWGKPPLTPPSQGGGSKGS